MVINFGCSLPAFVNELNWNENVEMDNQQYGIEQKWKIISGLFILFGY